MAIQKKLDFYNTGLPCEIWRIDNVPIFRGRVLVTVAGWLNKEHYDADLKKAHHVQAKQFIVEDKPEIPEQLDEDGEVEIPYQPAVTDFTDYFGNATLIQGGESPLANGYKYLMTLPEFEGGKEV